MGPFRRASVPGGRGPCPDGAHGPTDAAEGGPSPAPSRRGRRRWKRLGQLHFCVPLTLSIDDVPPGPDSAVNATLYGRLPPLQATEAP
jgi:hypothetical protein